MFQPIAPALDPDPAARASQRGRINVDLAVPDDQAGAPSPRVVGSWTTPRRRTGGRSPPPW